MKIQNLPSRWQAECLFLSMLGVGYIPFAPGTFGSLATVPFLYALSYYEVPLVFLIPIFLLILAGGSFASEYVRRKYHSEDPGWIVIDEFLGLFVTWLFYPTHDLFYLSIIFIFFRFFDIKKVWPINLVDQKMKNGFGVMADDLVAGIYAGICSLICIKLHLHFFA